MGMVKRAAEISKRFLPSGFLEKIDRKLLSTGILLSAEEYAGICFLFSLVGGVVAGSLAFLFLSPSLFLPFFLLGAVATFLGGTFGVPSYLVQRRAAKLERELPDALRQMASTLRAGMSIDVAMEEVARSGYGVLSAEFERALAEVRRGRPLVEALWAISLRSGSPLCERAFGLLIEGIERGVALADVLQAVARDIGEVHALQRERRATTTQQVLFLVAVSLFACPFILGLTVSIGKGGGGVRMPEGMDFIVLGYILIQASLCSLAVGIVRYGKVSKGLTFLVPFVVAAALVFKLSGFLV
ncbi:MAG: type II secretion system F family protein [Candidatus Hadarchaeales archaeon]